MGKALLFIISAIGAASLQTVVEANSVQGRSAVQQAAYENDVIAYQIARAGYNVAYGMIHDAPSLAEGVALVNSEADGLRGAYLGGEYRVTAGFAGGETVVIQAHGYYGGQWAGGRYVGRYAAGRYFEPSHHFIGDDRQTVVFHADRSDNRPRRLTGQFLQSAAGYCSAIFVQRFLPNTADNAQPKPEMMFEPGNTRDGSAAAFDLEVAPGTQLNFFIGVDQNCSMRPSGAATWTATQRRTYVTQFNTTGRQNPSSVTTYLAGFDYLHYALDLNVEDLANLRESPWAMIEQHRDGGERWRIGWEDIHNTAWLTGTTPQTSLRLTKERGYTGTGWSDVGVTGWSPAGVNRNVPDGYRDLRDFGSQPDFEDQVIEITLTPIEGSPNQAATPPRPQPAMPALLAANGGCPTGKTPMNRPSVRYDGRVDRVCVDPARVAAYVATGASAVSTGTTSTGSSSTGTTTAPPTTRVVVCHNRKNKTIDSSALQSHLNHGDTRGACTTTTGGGNDDDDDD